MVSFFTGKWYQFTPALKLYDNQVENFYIVSWIDKDTYARNYRIKSLPVGGGKWKDFYLYQLKNGKPLDTLKKYLFNATS